jgi:hypothetical protein
MSSRSPGVRVPPVEYHWYRLQHLDTEVRCMQYTQVDNSCIYKYSCIWLGKNISKIVYFCKIKYNFACTFTSVRNMVFLGERRIRFEGSEKRNC